MNVEVLDKVLYAKTNRKIIILATELKNGTQVILNDDNKSNKTLSNLKSKANYWIKDHKSGVIEIDKITELNQYNININNIAPLMAVNWIGRSKINPQNSFEEKITFYKSFIRTNYEAIIKNAINDYYESKSKHGLDFDLGISKETLNRINTDKKVRRVSRELVIS